MSSSHVACLLALSEAAHGRKLGDFMFFDVIMFFRRIGSEGRKELRASANQNTAGLGFLRIT